jgi:hypothetical protein
MRRNRRRQKEEPEPVMIGSGMPEMKAPVELDAHAGGPRHELASPMEIKG